MTVQQRKLQQFYGFFCKQQWWPTSGNSAATVQYITINYAVIYTSMNVSTQYSKLSDQYSAAAVSRGVPKLRSLAARLTESSLDCSDSIVICVPTCKFGPLGLEQRSADIKKLERKVTKFILTTKCTQCEKLLETIQFSNNSTFINYLSV